MVGPSVAVEGRRIPPSLEHRREAAQRRFESAWIAWDVKEMRLARHELAALALEEVGPCPATR